MAPISGKVVGQMIDRNSKSPGSILLTGPDGRTRDGRVTLKSIRGWRH